MNIINLHCQSCDFHNPSGMRFCGSCGAPLGTQQTEQNKLAIEIESDQQPFVTLMGSDLLERFHAAGLDASGQKRNVTVLFVDLSGFTPLSNSLEADVLYEVMQKFIRLLVNAVYKYDGMVDKLTGDGLMALFGAPLAYENNAERAVRSAIDMMEDVKLLSLEYREQLQDEELHLHMGINNGTVIVGGIGSNHLMNYTAIGDTVNIAHRLEEVAKAGQVLLSENIFRSTKPLFDFRSPESLNLKGIKEPVVVYEVIGPKANPGSTRGLQELGNSYIGNEREIQQIEGFFYALTNEKKGGLLLLTGEAGVGKTRLMRESINRSVTKNLQVLMGHTLTYRKSIPYWVFRDIFSNFWQLKQFSGEVRHQVFRSTLGDLLGEQTAQVLPYFEYIMGMPITDENAEKRIYDLGAEQFQLRIFIAVRRVLAIIARQQPLLMILDDLHWADEASLELLNYLIDAIVEEPILICGISRPFEGGSVERILKQAEKLLDMRHFLMIDLKPLALNDTEKLFESLLSMQDFPVDFRNQIIQSSSGLPLYMEEILRMLIEDNIIYYEDDSWKMNRDVKIKSLGVPETVGSLILTRFDRLNLTQRYVIQAASVIGNPFSVKVLNKMLTRYSVQEVSDGLNYLTHHEFIEPAIYGLARGYRFCHGLVSDAIYSTLLTSERKKLHQEVAEAIESLNPESLDDHIEMLAHHYNRSYQLDKALKYLIMAGKKAMRDYANEQARQHYVSALSLLSKVGFTTEQAYDIQTGLGDILMIIGEYPASRRHYATALEIILEDGSSEWLKHQSRLHRKIATNFERQGDYEKALSRLHTAEMVLKEAAQGNPVELSRIYSDIGWILFRRGNVELAEEQLLKALALIRGSNENRVMASIYNRLGGIYYTKGELELSDNYTRLSLELHEQLGETAMAARSYNNLGLIAWKRGQLNEALDYFENCFHLQNEFGDVEILIELNTNLGLLQMEFGHLKEAEGYILGAIEKAKRVGHLHHLSACYVHLTELYIQMEKYETALKYGELAREEIKKIGGSEALVTVQVHTGLALLGLGEVEAARRASRKALNAFKQKNQDGSSQVGLDDQANVFQLLGKIAQIKGQYGRARLYFQRGFKMSDKANRPLPAARTLLTLVEL
ncbi:MAG: tetratricopeptide repeat protein [Anaerolineaceae bacterium]|nr:tetratricopeptide repeat protein [Anaerolineaceae bacterium]